jgi:hypothetical protein
MRVTPDGEAIAYGRLRQRQRRVSRSRSVSPGDGLAAFLFSWGSGLPPTGVPPE